MLIKNKLFPYPILNADASKTSYKNGRFDLVYTDIADAQNFILKDCHYELDSPYLNSLINEGKVEVRLVVECSDTIYRESFKLSSKPSNIYLNKGDFQGNLVISMFAVATRDFILESDEFEDDYEGFSFEIDKYNILAVNDGSTHVVSNDEVEDNMVKSIFSIIVNESLETGPYEVDQTSGKKIVITLSKDAFKFYKDIYKINAYKEVFFNMILIPALVDRLSECRNRVNEGVSCEDLSYDYNWFRSILKAYRGRYGRELDEDELKTASLPAIAQKLLGEPFDYALKNLSEQTKANNLQEE